MKKLEVRKDRPCMACLSCVRACSEAFYKVFDQAKSCIQIVEKNGAVKVNTCVQCWQMYAHVQAWRNHAEPKDRRVYDQ